MAITITIPAQHTTAMEKLAYLLRLKDRCITVYNRVGVWHRTGATLAQYNTLLPSIVKSRYSYTPILSDADWKDFNVWFRSIINAIYTSNRQQIEDIKNDATITVNIDSEVSNV